MAFLCRSLRANLSTDSWPIRRIRKRRRLRLPTRITLGAFSTLTRHGRHDVVVFRPILGALVDVFGGANPSAQRTPRRARARRGRPVDTVGVGLPYSIPIQTDRPVLGGCLQSARGKLVPPALT